jgi:alkylation response protein AidB-like acyl-CoA dehydrogenase
MDFAPTHAMDEIRREIREVLDGVLPCDWQGSGFLPMDVRPEHFELSRTLDRALAARTLLAPSWPREYGGRGLTPYEQFALFEELGYRLAPRMTTISVDLVGPVLIHYGSDEQRARWLPAIANEAQIWCQGFSEPGAGSDLTSLTTRAERTGGEYVVNGQKIWTSMAHRAAWMILLARTSSELPRGRGLSLFAVSTDAPGIEIRPIRDAGGEHMLNEVFLRDLRVPASQLIGEENGGWHYATTLLQYERGDVLLIGQFRRLLDDVEHALRDRDACARDADASRAMLAECEIEWHVSRLLTLRVVGLHARGAMPDMEASVTKLFMTEAYQRLAAIATRVLGAPALLRYGDPLAPLGGRIEQTVVSSTIGTVMGGTSEVQRTIIATRGLGLPRG